MLTITESQEWVHHDRGGTDPALVRKYQKVAWDLLFKDKKNFDILHDLNNKFLPVNIKIVEFDLNQPEGCYSLLKELFALTDYDIYLTVKPHEKA